MLQAHRIAVGRWLVVLLSVATGCSRPPALPPPVAVKIKPLRAERVTSATRFSATVQPRQSVELAFKVAGTVERLYRVPASEGERDVQEGDVLPRDAVIAQLDQQDYVRQRDRAEAELAAASEHVRRAVASREFAQRELTRLGQLRQDGSVSQKELDDAQSQFTMADAEYQAATRSQEAGRQLYQQAVANFDECALRVPIDNATVVQKRTEPMERVEHGQPLFRIMDVSTVHVEFGVPDMLLGVAAAGADEHRLAVGRELQVFFDAFEGRTFVGRVTKIAPSADPNTRTFAVEVTLQNPDRLIKPGMIATVRVGEERDAVLLPMTAIQRGKLPGEMAVYAVELSQGRTVVRRRLVELGGVYNNQIEINLADSALSLGNEIVVTGAWRLQDGATVRVLPPDPDERLP